MTTEPKDDGAVSSLQRALALLRALADGPARVSELARGLGYTPATTHRLLQQLVAEGFVEQGAAGTQDKRYALGMELFALAARAGDRGGERVAAPRTVERGAESGADRLADRSSDRGLRPLCRPALLRLGAQLGDSVFLLVRAGFDAMCLDRWEGPFPIRTLTGDIGGRVPLGVGQGAMAILAHLPEEEAEEVIRYNVPRLGGKAAQLDGVFLRTEVARVRRQGFAAANVGLIDGMAGVGVPLFDAAGRVVAALSVGTLANRLAGDRLPVVVQLLQREAAALQPRINPFDPTLRRPAEALGAGD